jgi:GGDEF domain-containing protein
MKDVQIQVLLNILDEVTQRYDEIFEIKERLLREANYKSTHDLLTNLYNRSYFEAKVKL